MQGQGHDRPSEGGCNRPANRPTPRTQLKIPRHARPTTRLPVPVPRTPVWCRSGSSTGRRAESPAAAASSSLVRWKVGADPSIRTRIGSSLFLLLARYRSWILACFPGWIMHSLSFELLRKATSLVLGQIQMSFLFSFRSVGSLWIYMCCLRSLVC